MRSHQVSDVKEQQREREREGSLQQPSWRKCRHQRQNQPPSNCSVNGGGKKEDATCMVHILFERRLKKDFALICWLQTLEIDPNGLHRKENGSIPKRCHKILEAMENGCVESAVVMLLQHIPFPVVLLCASPRKMRGGLLLETIWIVLRLMFCSELTSLQNISQHEMDLQSEATEENQSQQLGSALTMLWGSVARPSVSAVSQAIHFSMKRARGNHSGNFKRE